MLKGVFCGICSWFSPRSWLRQVGASTSRPSAEETCNYSLASVSRGKQGELANHCTVFIYWSTGGWPWFVDVWRAADQHVTESSATWGHATASPKVQSGEQFCLSVTCLRCSDFSLVYCSPIKAARFKGNVFKAEVKCHKFFVISAFLLLFITIICSIFSDLPESGECKEQPWWFAWWWLFAILKANTWEAGLVQEVPIVSTCWVHVSVSFWTLLIKQ